MDTITTNHHNHLILIPIHRQRINYNNNNEHRSPNHQRHPTSLQASSPNKYWNFNPEGVGVGRNKTDSCRILQILTTTTEQKTRYSIGDLLESTTQTSIIVKQIL